MDKEKESKILPFCLPDDKVNDEQMDEDIKKSIIETGDRYEELLEADPDLDEIKAPANMLGNIQRGLAEKGCGYEGLKQKPASAAGVDAKDDYTSEELETIRWFRENGGNLEIIEQLRIAGRPDDSNPWNAEPEEEVDLEAILDEKVAASQQSSQRFRRRLKYAGAAVACLAAAFGMSMTSAANRAFLLRFFEGETRGNYTISVYGQPEAEQKNLVGDDPAEVAAHQEIQEKIGAKSVYFIYRPKGFSYESSSVTEEFLIASLVYNYQGTAFHVEMVVEAGKNNVSVTNINDKLPEVIDNDIYGFEIRLKAEPLDNSDQIIYVADFIYQGTYYNISAVMEKEIFVKMLEHILIK